LLLKCSSISLSLSLTLVNKSCKISFLVIVFYL
jgi:hypothetical protein